MSWDLSPSSATKMTPNARSVLARTASTVRYGPLWSDRVRGEDLDPAHTAWIEGLARLENQAARPDVRRGTSVCQCVDRDIGGYSPSLSSSLPGQGPPAHRDAGLPAADQPVPASRGSTASSGLATGSIAPRPVTDSSGEAHPATRARLSSAASQPGRPATASTSTQVPTTAVRATV